MSMFNDIVWVEKGNAEKCKSNACEVANYARRFLRGHWSLLGPGSEKKWCGTYSNKPDDVWDTTAEDMMLEVAESIHPYSVLPASLKGWNYEAKEEARRLFISTVASKTLS